MQPQTTSLDTSRLVPQQRQEPALNSEASEPATCTTPDKPAVKLTPEQMHDLQKRIVAALCSCFDPEIPVNIYELGLIYNVEMSTEGRVKVDMTLTSPACPVAGTLPGDVQRKLQSLEGVSSAKVDVVWDPPWDKNRMSEAAKLQLGIDD